MPKKLFTIILILLTGWAALVGAPASLPHFHGNDVDHSENQDCPLYQISLYFGLLFITVVLCLLFYGAVFFGFLKALIKSQLFNFFVFRVSFLKAPPSTSSFPF